MQFSFDVDPILDPLRRTSKLFVVTMVALLAIIGFGAFLWTKDLLEPVPAWGMNRPMFWGISISSFVFYVSLSLAGTLISAVLRLAHAEWRRPISRCAELLTVLSLIFAVVSILMDMGRPDRLFNVTMYPQFKSPIIWDVIAINGYLGLSTIFLYLPLITDLAILRDKKIGYYRLYRILALGYTGTDWQKKWLGRLTNLTTVLIIPVGVSVHTVTAYIFSTTLQPAWHSAIYGPFFVIGAVYTGTAALVIIMALMRWFLKLGHILKDKHFENLGWVLFVSGCVFGYFLVCIYLVDITGQETLTMEIVESELTGEFALAFWGMVVLGVFVPLTLLLRKKGRTVLGGFLASVPIVIGLWLDRYLIILPTLSHPRLPWPKGHYDATWEEWYLAGTCVATFAAIYLAFIKIFPIIPIAEVQEGVEESVREAEERTRQYLPDGSEPELDPVAQEGEVEKEEAPAAEAEPLKEEAPAAEAEPLKEEAPAAAAEAAGGEAKEA